MAIQEGTLINLQAGEEVISGKSLGNWYIFTTNKRHIRLLWEGEVYKVVEDIPNEHELSVNVTNGAQTIGDDIRTYNGIQYSFYTTFVGNDDPPLPLNDVITQYNGDRRAILNTTRGIFMVRTAIELKDGTYILHSEPILVGGNTGVVGFKTYNSYGKLEGLGFQDTKVYSPRYTITGYENLLLHKDDIAAVVVAVTKIYNEFDQIDVESRDIFKDIVSDGGISWNLSANWKNKLTDAGWKLIEDIALTADDNYVRFAFPEPYEYENRKLSVSTDGNYFIVKRIPLTELATDFEGDLIIDWSNISANEILSIDDTRYRDKLVGGKLKVYNKRMHIFDYSRVLSPSKSPYVKTTNPASPDNYLVVYIKENNEQYKVVTNIGKHAGVFKSNIVSYPHIGAYRMQVITDWTNLTPGLYHITMDVELVAHPILNLSYYAKLGSDNAYASPPVLSTVTPGIPFSNDLISYKNTFIVSNFNLPSIYEARHSYSFGDGEMIGIGISTFAFSEGQYGEYPLHIFTTSGIWALRHGSGDVLYAFNTAVSNEIAINGDAITGTHMGAFFVSKNGLCLIQGSDVRVISENIRLKPEHPLLDLIDYNLFIGKPQVEDSENLYLEFPELYPFLSTDSFLEYVKAARIAYSYGIEKEVVISNPAYPYSYVYNLEKGYFYKVSEVWDAFIDNYPELLGVKTEALKVFDLNIEEKQETIPVMIETNPIKFQTDKFKKIERSVLRGYFDVTEKNGGLYLFISNDARKWQLVDFEQALSPYVDLHIKSGTPKVVYFKFLFTGEISPESYIEYLQAEISVVDSTKTK